MEVVFCSKDKELLPVRATEGSIGLDIKVAEKTVIQPKSISLVSTGLKVMLPKGLALCMYLRSSTPIKKGLIMANAVGVIDSDYRGEIKIQLYNITDEPVELSAGERIGQLVIVQQAGVKGVVLSDVICNGFCDTNMYNNFEEMFPTGRGGGGFGSTGIGCKKIPKKMIGNPSSHRSEISNLNHFCMGVVSTTTQETFT